MTNLTTNAIPCPWCRAPGCTICEDPFLDDGTPEAPAARTQDDDAEYEAYLEAQAEQQWEDAGCPEGCPDWLPQELP
jgi:hypothetical protein